MSLREGLLRVRAGEAAHPAAVAAFSLLAAEHGTPLYVYDAGTIRENARALRDAFAPRFRRLKLRYALKANTNVSIVRLLLGEGLAPEVVSEGEIRAAPGPPPPPRRRRRPRRRAAPGDARHEAQRVPRRAPEQPGLETA
ncbi:MAG: hypothetical protein KJ062_00805, partial [Thermoanaerobaculia bacterium]|nr:hypothetical protein [Thermoanaerobaculia bacterium]